MDHKEGDGTLQSSCNDLQSQNRAEHCFIVGSSYAQILVHRPAILRLFCDFFPNPSRKMQPYTLASTHPFLFIVQNMLPFNMYSELLKVLLENEE
jgi:hypothetical protein